MTPSNSEKITDSEFKNLASIALDKIEGELERLFESTDFDVDLERQASVLSISFPNKTDTSYSLMLSSTEPVRNHTLSLTLLIDP